MRQTFLKFEVKLTESYVNIKLVYQKEFKCFVFVRVLAQFAAINISGL